MIKKTITKLVFITLTMLFTAVAWAGSYTVNFEGVDIKEFINAVGKNLNKNFIISQGVGGTIDIRSYELLGEEEYFAFFEYVLTTYGYSLVTLDNNVYKVVPSQVTKSEPIPIIPENTVVNGDGVITKIIKAEHIAVGTLVPNLRQLVDEAGAGNVSHQDGANVIVLTGRASVVNRLEQIIREIDFAAGDQSLATIVLQHAKASEVVKLIDALNTNKDAGGQGGVIKPTLVADDRTNTILIATDDSSRSQIERLIHRLDKKMALKSDTKVFYLQFAKAENIANVLQGLPAATEDNTVAVSTNTGVKITADNSSNALIVTAAPERMQILSEVISQLDIRRAQVLIEALIVEVTENNNLHYGVQWSNDRSAMVQFTGNGASISSALLAKHKRQGGDYVGMSKIASGINGVLASVAFGDWNMLVSALAGSNRSNILAAPSLMVLDNEEASFIVGEEVPVKTGEQTNGNFDKAFSTIERKDVGIKLNIKPQINQGSLVQMKLKQEISNVIGANGAVDVRFGKRQLSTTVMAADRQMIVLSGLIDQRNGQTVAKVPLLGDIPLLGEIFKDTKKSGEKRHLMLFIKPTIIRSDSVATQASRQKYAQIRGIQGASSETDGMNQLPPYEEMLNYPPEVQVIQQQLGDL